jgi:hypothetical protein
MEFQFPASLLDSAVHACHEQCFCHGGYEDDEDRRGALGLRDTSPTRLGSRSDPRWDRANRHLGCPNASPNRPTIEIQVKTASARGKNPSWALGDITQLTEASEHEWFVLVLLPNLPLPPRAFVVPRDHVCAATWISHQGWLTDPSAPEGTRNASLSRARVSLDVWQGYEDCWDLLGTPTSKG